MLKNCVICGKAFEARRAAKTCGAACGKTLKAERNRRWRAENPEKTREGKRRWRAENPEKAREESRRWRAENPEKAREGNRRWYAENPEKAREESRRSKQKAKDLKTLSNLLAMQAGFTVENHHV